MRTFSLSIISIFCLVYISAAQEFPASKEQAMDRLTASAWNIKWLVIDERKLDAELINMNVTISFRSDSTYVMNFMSENRKGSFIVDMEEKNIRLTSDKKSNEILISSLSKNELWAQSTGDGEEEPVMIMVIGKKK